VHAHNDRFLFDGSESIADRLAGLDLILFIGKHPLSRGLTERRLYLPDRTAHAATVRPIGSKNWLLILNATAKTSPEKEQFMGKERFSERQTAVFNAAARLEEVAALPQTDIVRDAAIQRFEFTFELVWKTLQLYLEHEGLESGGPRAVLKRTLVWD
jgi:Nucleotidyltransferase substrate binding protein like